jgi:hypothetical protein
METSESAEFLTIHSLARRACISGKTMWKEWHRMVMMDGLPPGKSSDEAE